MNPEILHIESLITSTRCSGEIIFTLEYCNLTVKRTVSKETTFIELIRITRSIAEQAYEMLNPKPASHAYCCAQCSAIYITSKLTGPIGFCIECKTGELKPYPHK